ncbi:hypothetical protein M422DRAFT_25458 [Sphaerobolus stellatus SS14]|nr:hypothetical protein M422DRAFT_25458 [Sphaerobolus stellatus SS14]
MSHSSLPTEVFVGLVAEQAVTIYNNVAASAFFFWELCITFADEVDFIWKGRWSTISLLFFVSRYLSLAIRVIQLLFYANITGLIHPTAAACRAWVKFEIVSGHVMLLTVDILLAIRTYAFYNRDRRILFFLVAVVLGGQVAAIYIISVVTPGFVAVPPPLPARIPLGACVVLGADRRFPYYLLPTVIVETVLSVLIAARFIRMRWTTKAQSSSIMLVFIRDGIWAYVMVFAFLMWTFVAYRIAPQKGDIAIAWLYNVLSFCGTRLILNLRAEAPKNKQLRLDSGHELHNIRGVLITTSTITGTDPYGWRNQALESNIKV